MLIHHSIALHNVVELEPAEGGGLYLRRFPKNVREVLSPLGRLVAQESAGSEIRFVTGGNGFRLAVSALPSVLNPYYEKHTQDAIVFRGSYFHSRHHLEPGRITHLNVLNFANEDRFNSVGDAHDTTGGFSRNVWRVFFGRYPVAFHSLDTYGWPVRPPRPDEIPTTQWLAYGSSITSGTGATLHHNGYVYHAARQLGVDVINQGLAGACHCEPQMAAYLGGRDDWRMITLEIGVNMRGGFTAEQFRQRATNLLDAVCRERPGRQITLITSYPNFASAGWTADKHSTDTLNEVAFNAILRELAQRSDPAQVRLLEGRDILRDLGDLTTDLIHPSDFGHAAMGARLAALLQRDGADA